MAEEDDLKKSLLSETFGLPSSLMSFHDIATVENGAASIASLSTPTGTPKKSRIATRSDCAIRIGDGVEVNDVSAKEHIDESSTMEGIAESSENTSCIVKGLTSEKDRLAKNDGPEISLPLERLLMFLYISHFLSRWGGRMWEFAVGLFMIAIRPGSLVLPAMYGLVEAASVAAFGVVVGEWVDKFPRLKVAQVSLGVQNGSIVTAALAVVVLLVHPNSAPGGFKVFIMLVALVNAFGAVGALAGLANNILVERDWVVIIAEGQAPGLLTRINAGMRRIDLSCKLLAPVAVGVLMSSVSILASAVLIATWNLLSVGFEYWLLYSVYSAIPALQQYKDNQQVSSKTTHSSYSEDIDNDIQVVDGLHTAEIADYRQLPTQDSNVGVVSQKQGTLVSLIKGLKGHVFQFFHGWNVYIYQEAALAAVALALLYFTVLSFGTLMTAFLQMRGVPPYVLGLARAVAAAVGIAATFTYPILQARLQTIRVGIWSIWLQDSSASVCERNWSTWALIHTRRRNRLSVSQLERLVFCSTNARLARRLPTITSALQWVFLGVSVASIWVQNNKISSSMLIGGVAASRLGLWMFDLSVTQLMQESVPEAERGVVGGVQNSLQSLMDMLSYVIAVFAPRPQDFGKLVLVSYGVVSTAAMLYSFHVRRVRGHLVHIDHYLRSR